MKWKLDQPIMFQAGLPSKQDLLELPSESVLVIDDLYSEACKADHISYLFRVLSGKKRLHVFIMTQRYCAEDGKGLNIRNSSNIHILMNNVNVRTNRAVCLSMGLKEEYETAQKVNSSKLYPYILLDRSNEARVSELQVYTDILSKFKQVITKQMVQYIISEADFLAHFTLVDENFAVQNENKKEISSISSENSTKVSSASYTTDTDKQSGNEQSRTETNPSTEESFATGNRKRQRERNRIKSEVRRALQQYKVHTKLQR